MISRVKWLYKVCLENQQLLAPCLPFPRSPTPSSPFDVLADCCYFHFVYKGQLKIAATFPSLVEGIICGLWT